MQGLGSVIRNQTAAVAVANIPDPPVKTVTPFCFWRVPSRRSRPSRPDTGVALVAAINHYPERKIGRQLPGRLRKLSAN